MFTFLENQYVACVPILPKQCESDLMTVMDHQTNLKLMSSVLSSFVSMSSTVGVLAEGAQWTAIFEAKSGLGGEGGLGQPHTGDE